MSSGIISIGITGLNAAQLGLLTTGHNVTNANTPGYSRQRIVQDTNVPQLTGAGFVGQGVHVSTIERMYSSFLTSQVNRAQTNVSELDAYSAQISQIDNMLADTNAGLSPALQEFFKGVQSVAANPSQVASRQSMISSAQALTARFQSIESRLGQMYEGANTQITSTVSGINAYAQQIASLNERIVLAQSSIGQPANDLLDQRDQLVSELNKLVGVTTTENSDGTYNVFIGNGQQLVVGAQTSTMTAAASVADPSRIVIGLKTPAGNQELPESMISGGALSGYLNFRSQSLDRSANELGRIAVSMALTFNAQNSLGQDLQGNVAGDANFVGNFFNVPAPKVLANALNTATSPTVSVSYTSPPPFNGNFYTDLTNSDYRLNYDGSNLKLTRLSDNYTWTAANVTALNTALATDSAGPQGFSLDPATFVAADAGANYLIQPTRDAARNISVNAVVAADTRLIAAAAPIRTSTGSSNTGTATISAGSVATGYTAPAAALSLTYSGGNLTGFPAGAVSVTSNGTTTNYTYPVPDATIPYTSGATISFSGISFEINGSPGNGDTFNVAKNINGVSDNRNALLLAKLQTQNTMAGQKATYQADYAQLVSDVGNKAREIKVTGDAQQALLEQSTSAREALSGVNLDEEAANLIRFQQAYQAAAKMLDIGSKLFDVILAIRS